MPKPHAFFFDPLRCTGCGACIVACANQNHGEQHLNWRNLHKFNERGFGNLPMHVVSMACNHCEEPACQKNCPADAYKEDPESGAIYIDGNRCIGCKYCSWACPYDAPKYCAETGITEKCDFCKDRLKTEGTTACISACPVEALSLLEQTSEDQKIDHTKTVPGIPLTELKPSLHFGTQGDGISSPRMTDAPPPMIIKRHSKSLHPAPPSRITIRHEWTLLLFTLMASILVGFQGAFIVKPIPLNPFIFMAFGLLSILFSTVHLGKKLRAYRAISNIRTSWLSREIFLYMLFFGSASLYMTLLPGISLLGYFSVGIGFLCLYSVDKLYDVTLKIGPLNYHSADALLNGVYFMGLFTYRIEIVFPLAVLKMVLYGYRRLTLRPMILKRDLLISMGRVLLGLLIPVLYLFMDMAASGTAYLLLIVLTVMGELIDRVEYYQELDLLTPEKQMNDDLWKQLSAL